MIKQSASESIAHLAEQSLLGLARNESGLPEFRKAAVKIMLEKRFASVNHPELAELLAAIKRETEAQDEVESIVESAIESEIPSGPFRASVTTATMQQDEFIRNPQALGDDALAENAEAVVVSNDPEYPFLGEVQVRSENEPEFKAISAKEAII